MSNSASVASSMHTFAFNGNRISFRQGRALMVSATQMSKPFCKQPVHWLRLQQSQEFIAVLCKLRNSILADLVQIKKGGMAPGTWFHEDVALEFARWLSPEFAIWCNDRIKELLTKGMTTIDPIRYVPMQQYREQVRLAEFEHREAQTWHARSQAYLALLEKSAANQAKMSEAMLSLTKASPTPLTPTAPTWMTIVGYATLHNIPCGLPLAARLGRKATDLCTRQGIVPDTIPDPRFGRVNTYPMQVLEEVFAIR